MNAVYCFIFIICLFFLQVLLFFTATGDARRRLRRIESRQSPFDLGYNFLSSIGEGFSEGFTDFNEGFSKSFQRLMGAERPVPSKIPRTPRKINDGVFPKQNSHVVHNGQILQSQFINPTSGKQFLSSQQDNKITPHAIDENMLQNQANLQFFNSISQQNNNQKDLLNQNPFQLQSNNPGDQQQVFFNEDSQHEAL